MVRHSCVNTELRQVHEKFPERGTVGKQNCVMIKSKSTSTWNRARPFSLDQLDENRVVAVSGEIRSVALLVGHAKSHHALVILERSAQIRYLQSHWSESGFLGKSIAFWTHTMW